MKRKLKKGPIIGLIVIIILIILAIIGYHYYQKYQEYINSYPYKLEQLGYNEKQIKTIETLENIDHILEIEYEPKLTSIIKQKYFIEKNLDQYLEYYKENQDKSLEDVIAIINVKANEEHYENTVSADLTKENLILVNKYHQLPQDYAPENIQTIPLKYAYSGNELPQSTLDAYKEMWEAAKQEDITLIATSAYRSYESQDTVYQSFLKKNGQEYADQYAARPGYSEHQTGLSIDIFGYGTNKQTFEDSEAFTWLTNNAYKYGFILRYPKDKEYLTGYSYESWHYRYVGVEVATKIKNENITFDEYYAYYIENGD